MKEFVALFYIMIRSCLCLTEALGPFFVLSAHAGSCQPFKK